MASTPVIWKKRILVPFWVVRILLMLFIIAAYAWAIKVLKDDPDKTAPVMGVTAFFMLLIVAVLLMDVLAILLFLRGALKPGTFLIMNSVQTGFWAGVMIMDMVAVARGASAVGFGFSIFVLLTFIGLLIYAIVNYRHAKQQAQRGNYAPAHNPAAPHLPTPGAHPPAYTNAAPYQNTAYYPPSGGGVELQQDPYKSSGAAADYYNTQPARPAQMV